MSISKLVLNALLWSHAAAVFIDINVGESGLTFSPSSTTANVGDMLVFHFFPPSHSVIQGVFGSGCQAMSGGFFSGFMPTSSGQAADIFVVEVTSTDPIFFYCGAPGHCPSGMCGVVNPTSDETFAAYQASCKAATSVGVPSAVGGGTVEPASDETSPSSSSPTTTTTMPSSTTTTAQASPPTTSTSVSGEVSSIQPSASTQPSAAESSTSSAAGETSSASSTAGNVGTTATTQSSTATASTVVVSGGKGRYDEIQWALGFQAVAAAVFILLAA